MGERGFDPRLRAVSGREPHTLRDLSKYVRANLGSELIKRLRAGTDIYILEGNGADALARFAKRGWRPVRELAKTAGFHRAYLMKRGAAEAIAISRVNGEDRIIDVQGLIKLAGGRGSQVATVRGFHSWKPTYRDTFRRLGHQPDLVIYGLSWPAASALLQLGDHFDRKAMSELFPRDETRTGGSDIAQRSMKVIRFANGQRIWLMQPLYGQLAGDFTEALFKHGVGRFLYLGTAGAVDPGLRLGDWLSPARMLGADGRERSLTRLHPIPGLPKTGLYQRVPTANLQTQRWIRRASARKVAAVETELGHVLRVLDQYPEVPAHAALLMSVVLQGPNVTDYSTIGLGEIPNVEESIRSWLNALGITRANGFIPTGWQSVRFE
jgi:hypothetical protein